jgi:hypothetical protein
MCIREVSFRRSVSSAHKKLIRNPDQIADQPLSMGGQLGDL